MDVDCRLRRGDYLLLGLFSFGLFCYACFGGRVLTQHEARLPQASIEMAAAGEWLVPTCGGRPWLERPPFPHWMTIGIASLFGIWDQVWVFRIPNALAGMVTVLLTGWLAARQFGREVGLLSGLMLATSYEFLHYSWLAEEDVYLAAAVLIGMALFVYLEFPVRSESATESRSFFGNRSLSVWLFFLILGLTNLVKGLLFAAVMVGLSGGVWLLLSGDPRRLFRYFWLWGIVLFGFAASWWVVAVSIRYPEMLGIWSGDLRNRADGSLGSAPFWMYGETLLWTMMPWTVPAIVGLVQTFRTARRKPYSADRWLLCWSIVPILFLSIPTHKHHHYLVPCLAPWAILAAIGGRTLWESVPRWPVWCRQPVLSAAVFGIPVAVALWIFREKIPGPEWIPVLVAALFPAAILITGYALLDRHGHRAMGMLLGMLAIGYCGAYSYHGVYVDRYRTEAEFVEKAAAQVPIDETIYVNAEGAILNTFRNLFYLGSRGKTLHNLTFLQDKSITADQIYLIGMRECEDELRTYGSVEEVLSCSYVPRRNAAGSQWVMYRVTFDPDLPRYPNDVRISALQAMERVKGPYLGRQGASGIRRVGFESRDVQ